MQTKKTSLVAYVAVMSIIALFGSMPILFNFVVDPFNMNRLFDLVSR